MKVIVDINSSQGWMKVMEGKCNATEEFRRMFGNVDAVTDSPACFYWKEILEAFPDAKVQLFVVFKQ